MEHPLQNGNLSVKHHGNALGKKATKPLKSFKTSILLTVALAIFGWANALAQNTNPPIDRAALETMIANGEDVTQVNTSQITDMSELFQNNGTFNQNISSWDVSNVTGMQRMFQNAEAFNQNLSGWDVSSVTTMNAMFNGAIAFNRDLSSWEVDNVTDMWGMFNDATAFNGDLSSWDVSNVTTMQAMFFNATAFNGDLSGWEVGNVTTMWNMFFKAEAFNQDISSWEVDKVTIMRAMFDSALVFDQNLSEWDVSKVTNMNSMFRDATAFNQDLSGWNTCMVSSSISFSSGATAWTMPMPDFTPCSEITGATGWRLLSLPKTEGTVADIADDTAVQGISGALNPGAAPNFVIYDDTGDWESPVDISTPWGDGYGFALYFYDNTNEGSTELPLTLDATVAEPSSDVTVALNATVPVSGSYFTLAGNPFASGFDASSITSTGSGIQDNVHFWDNAMGSYSAQDRTMPYIVSPWQGFWVEVLASNTGPTTGITLPTSGKTDAGATGTFFSKQAANRGDIAFALSSETTYDEALRLSFRETATLDFDVHDASKLTPLLSEYATMAFKSNGVLKSVESLPWQLTEAITVPMEEILVGVSGGFTLAWEGLESVPAAWALTFHDYETGTNLDMRSVSEYTFDAVAPVVKVNPLSILTGPVAAVQKSKTADTRFAITVTPNMASVNTEGEDRASVFALEQNYPNPFNPSTVINYSVANSGKVSLSVYNLLGQKVAQLVNGTKAAGNYNVTWNATAATSGVYYYRLETGGQVLAQKMMLIK